MDQKYIVALELSGSQVKGATAKIADSEYAPGITPVVDHIVCESAANCVQYGVVQNLIEATQSTNFVLQKLANMQELSDASINGVYMGISGRSLISTHTTVQFDLPQEMEITQEILDNLPREATKSIPADKKVLKVLPRKYAVDNKATTNPVGTIGSSIRGEYTVVYCNATNKRNLELVAERVKMPIKDFIVTPLAIADLVLGEEEKQLGCVLVDVGSQTTTVSIYKDRALQRLVTLPLGSKNITRDIAMGLKLTDERAELNKIEQGDAMPKQLDKSESSSINRYVQARAGEIIANITAHISFAGFKEGELPKGIILTGRGSKLRNFREYLAQRSKMDVRLASVSESMIQIEDRNINPNDYISILAIVNSASAHADDAGCVTFNSQQEEAEAVAPDFDVVFDGGDDFDLDDKNDADAKRAKKEEQAAKKRQKEEQRRKEEEEKRRRKEQKALEKQNPRSLLDRLKSKISSIMDDNEDDDTDI